VRSQPSGPQEHLTGARDHLADLVVGRVVDAQLDTRRRADRREQVRLTVQRGGARRARGW
jgi:hypothetical protein